MRFSDNVFYRKMYFSFPMKEEPALREVYAALIKGRANILVDCGVSYNYPDIAQLLAEAGLTVADIDAVILTHCHADHTGGLFKLRQENPKLQIWGHPLGKPMIEDIEKQFAFRPVAAFHFLTGGPVKVDGELADGDVLEEACGARVIYTPGHSADSLSLYLPGEKLILSGDAIPYVRDVPIYEDLNQLVSSIGRLKGLPSSAVISSFCGLWEHGKQGDLFSVTARYLNDVQKAVDKFILIQPDAPLEAMSQFVLDKIGVPGKPIPIFLNSLKLHVQASKNK